MSSDEFYAKLAALNRTLDAAEEARLFHEKIPWWQFRAKSKARREWHDLVKLATVAQDELHATR